MSTELQYARQSPCLIFRWRSKHGRTVSELETAKHVLSCIRNGGLRLGISLRTFAGLAGYTLLGSGYKVFSRANDSANGS